MFDTRQFRNALGHFATGVTVVTTLDAERQPVGVTVNSFSSVSLEPPLILWSLAKKSFSRTAFETHPSFAVHVLAADQEDISNRFARAGEDKFAGVQTRDGLDDVPVLPGCAAVFECNTEFIHDGGDHIILVGRVQRFATSERPPLLFYRGQYAVPEPEHSSPFSGLMRVMAAATA
ncbi:flavin reductase family protein [Nitrogeniibacter aestuarii]|uniref:flavin reductase family protein n=1 Tax=Nitrogeniibacter aestuarii TaxID=2815343 RepID=UPI001D1206B2|nr:flavin reductase family protein [Nitrogeniibacter aestuarii]